MTETKTLSASFTRDGTNDMFVAKYLLAAYPAVRRLARREAIICVFALVAVGMTVAVTSGSVDVTPIGAKLLIWLSLGSILCAAANTRWIRLHRRLSRAALRGTAREAESVSFHARAAGFMLSGKKSQVLVAWTQIDWVGPVSDLYIGIRSAHEMDVILIPCEAFGDRHSAQVAQQQLQELLRLSGADARTRLLQSGKEPYTASCQCTRSLDLTSMDRCPDCGGIVSALSLQLGDLAREPWWRLLLPFSSATRLRSDSVTPTACPECGYSLRGLSIDRCPECGTARPTDAAPLLSSMSEQRRRDISRGLLILQVWLVLQWIWVAHSMMARFAAGTVPSFTGPIERALNVADWGVLCLGCWLAAAPPMRPLCSVRADRILFWMRICSIATMCSMSFIELFDDLLHQQPMTQGLVLAIVIPSTLGQFALILAHQAQLAVLSGDGELTARCRFNMRLGIIWLAASIALLARSDMTPDWIDAICFAILAWACRRVWVALTRLRKHLKLPSGARGPLNPAPGC